MVIRDACDLLEGATEMGADCTVNDTDRLEALRRQLELAGASHLVTLLDRAVGRVNRSADTLLESYYVLSAVHDRVMLDSLVR